MNNVSQKRLLWTLAVCASFVVLAACGAKSPLIVPDVIPLQDAAQLADGSDARCTPAPEVCNGRDDDCNGLVDDVDHGHDGVTDCLRILIMGNPGRNPSSNFGSWLRGNGARVDRQLTTSTERITRDLLSNYNIVMLDWLTRDYDATEADALRAWVEAGGGLVSLTGFEYPVPTIDRPNSLLRPLGLGYTAGFFDQPVLDFTPHPTTVGLSMLPFSGGTPVTVLDGVDAGAPGTVMIAHLLQRPVGCAHEQGLGRVFVWGDEWVEFDSEWRATPMVNVFWVNVLGWLSHQR